MRRALVLIALSACAPAAPPLVTNHQAALNGAPMPSPPCRAPVHGQFDFWVGQWNVFDPTGAQVGTNVVRRELDGCAVEESWTDSGGGRGRSLNAYDATTGRWHQTWVADALGHLRMVGGIDAQGKMVLTGKRISATTGFELFDRYAWTRLAVDQVRQEGTLDIPARDLHFSFDGLYRRVPHVTPAPEVGSGNCQVGGSAAASRDFDFAIGDWRVALQAGPALARSTLTTDLSGCLFQEDLRAPVGYQARSFVYFDPLVRRWFQTLVNNRGDRVELSGTLSNGALVLRSDDPDPLRVTWQSAAGGLTQTWEVSLDSGANFTPVLVLRYRP